MQSQLQQPEQFPIIMPGSPFGINWGFTYGYQGGRNEVFLPQARQIGAGATRVFFSWNQLEPEPEHYDWHALDTLLDQLTAPDEALIMLNSVSTWATRVSAELLPPSPARDHETYYRFIYAVVSHCRGRVRYWQNDNEPSNAMFWQGTVDEFIEQLIVFHQAVKAADPEAQVVLGGFDGLFNPFDIENNTWGQEGLNFFERVIHKAHPFFDVFDIHLYSNPYLIPAQIDFIRRKMQEAGTEKPIISAEYHGPGFADFSVNMHYMQLLGQWMSSVNADAEEMESIQQKIRDEMSQLYERMGTLPPETQMFMVGCSQPLTEKWYRLNGRDMVIRTVLALSAGVQKLYYWNLWADTSDRLEFMNLMFGKHKLMEYEGGRLAHYYPSAYIYERMVQALIGVEQVTRLTVPEDPSMYTFEVRKEKRDAVIVIWQQRDSFTGEDEPPIMFSTPWSARDAHAIDALGEAIPVEVREGKLHLPVSLTPIFVELVS